MENLSLRKSKENPTDLKEEFKIEKEKEKLSLRKAKINNIIFSKRKITNKIYNKEEIKQKYNIKLDDIQISAEYKLDIPSLINKVRIIYILSFI